MLIQLGALLDNALEIAGKIVGIEPFILKNVVVIILLAQVVKNLDGIFGLAIVHEANSLVKPHTVVVVDEVDRPLRTCPKRARHGADYNKDLEKGCFHIVFVFRSFLLYIQR